MMHGKALCDGTTRRYGPRSSRSVVRSSTRPEMDSSPRSPTRPLLHLVLSRSSGCLRSIEPGTDSAPQVRIGLHAAEATVMADDYAGMGVHQAARVGALAEAGEIVVTCETVEAQPIGYAVSDERSVSLKGIARPVRVVSID